MNESPAPIVSTTRDARCLDTGDDLGAGDDRAVASESDRHEGAVGGELLRERAGLNSGEQYGGVLVAHLDDGGVRGDRLERTPPCFVIRLDREADVGVEGHRHAQGVGHHDEIGHEVRARLEGRAERSDVHDLERAGIWQRRRVPDEVELVGRTAVLRERGPGAGRTSWSGFEGVEHDVGLVEPVAQQVAVRVVGELRGEVCRHVEAGQADGDVERRTARVRLGFGARALDDVDQCLADDQRRHACAPMVIAADGASGRSGSVRALNA